ncbi:MAG: hypothetical protein ABI742_09915 [Gemmatimonadota bacterium]
MPVERVSEEGPVEHIRNALQIVNGLSYLLETIDEHPDGDDRVAPMLVRESAEGLEHRLSIALAQLIVEKSTEARRPAASQFR